MAGFPSPAVFVQPGATKCHQNAGSALPGSPCQSKGATIANRADQTSEIPGLCGEVTTRKSGAPWGHKSRWPPKQESVSLTSCSNVIDCQ